MYQVSVDTTPGGVVIAPANPQRKLLVVTAPATNGAPVFLKVDGSTATLTTGTGMPLQPGQSLVSQPSDFGCDLPFEIRGIVAGSAQTIAVQEYPQSAGP